MTFDWFMLTVFAGLVTVLWFIFQRTYVKFEDVQKAQVENEKKIIEISLNLSNAIKATDIYQSMNNEQLKQINEALKKQISAMEKLTDEIGSMNINVSKIEQMLENYPKIEQRLQDLEIKVAANGKGH